MLKKLILGTFMLAEAAKVASAADINYTEVCMQKAPDPSEFGYVCLEARSLKYLRCYLPGSVALLMDCPAGTFCSSVEGEWTYSNPCGTSAAPYCGDGEVDPDNDEECEIGGLGCSENCTCEDGFEPTEPYSANCRLVEGGCGDGTVGEGEECEVGGLGCSSDCKCTDGYVPQTPAAVDCAPSSEDDGRLRDICRAVSGANESGYVCLSEDSTEYLRCALADGVSAMMPCPAGTRCKASKGVFQVYNPCGWMSADYPPVFPEDSDSGSKIVSDSDSDSEAEVPVEGSMHGSEEESQYVPINYDYSVLCELYGRAGYYCANTVNPKAGPEEFIYCGMNGEYTFELACAEGTYCSMEGFRDENPCTARTSGSAPVCGNAIVEHGEECESGFGCDAKTCKCKSGFYPSSSPDGVCIMNYSAVCEVVHARMKESGIYYFCPAVYSPQADSSAVVECRPGEPARTEKCPDGEFCSVPGLHAESACKSAAPRCGNGKVESGEECEAGGVGCNPETCRCEEGYHRTDEEGASVNCIKNVEPQPVASYAELCAGFGVPGYFCAAAFNKSEPDTMALQCGAKGALSGEFHCPVGTTCRAKDFTVYNPCEAPAVPATCGDGVVSGEEECESGGIGCNEKECTCLPGYAPAVPPSRNCELNDYAKICADHGLGKEKTLAVCLDGFNKSFLVCSKDGAASSFMTACPPGTSCTNKNTPIDGMPCTV